MNTNKKNTKQKSSKFTLRKVSKSEISKPFTHLFQNNKNLDKISTNLQLSTLSVLYYHNNSLSKLENLHTAINLRQLYLQRNKIEKIENLECLVNLEKLYLGYNKISVVEGLEKLANLRELHLERQDIDGDQLCFDSRSIFGIANSLEVLVIPHNNISTLTNLIPLKYLTYLDASHNRLNDARDICDTICHWHYFYEASFIGNPVTKQRQYRENITLSSQKLEKAYLTGSFSALLDNKEIKEITRTFLKRLEQEKLKKASRPSVNIPEWAKEYGHPALQKAVYHTLLKKPSFDNTTMASNVDDMFLPWKALPTSKNKIGKFTMSTLK